MNRNGNKIPAHLKGILFDLDGTILDSMPWHIKAWQEIFSRQGIRIKDEFLYLNEGAIEFSHLLDAVEKQGLARDKDLIQALLLEQAEHFKANFAQFVTPFADALSSLERLRNMDLDLGLITSSTESVVAKVLGPEIRSMFSIVITGDQVKNGKPHPEPYLTGLKKLNLENTVGLAVENAPAGIRSAKAAGLACAALTTTLDPKHLVEADAICTSLTEMTDLIARRTACP